MRLSPFSKCVELHSCDGGVLAKASGRWRRCCALLRRFTGLMALPAAVMRVAAAFGSRYADAYEDARV